MKILITDVTYMKEGGSLCLAGWDAANRRMVRPLPKGNHWNPSTVHQFGIAPGVTILVEPKGVSPRDYPHRIEDQPIDPDSIKIAEPHFTDWTGAKGPYANAFVAEAFKDKVARNSEYRSVWQGVHVAAGTHCPSLAGVNIPKRNLALVEEFNKLKAIVDDRAVSYKLAVTCKALRDAWAAGGLSAVRAAIPQRDLLHVRFGLAHAFEDPPKCYMMLNGVL